MKRKKIVSGPINGPLIEKEIDRGPAKYNGVAGPGLKTPHGGRVPIRQINNRQSERIR